MTGLLASRSFGLDDQTGFAHLSSDFNPIHLDQSFARRTQAGAPIVHGIHTLLWAANAALKAFPITIANISARFPQPLYLDEVASVRLKSRTDRQIDVEVVAANTVVALVKLSSVPGKTATSPRQVALNAPGQLSQPANPAFTELAGQTGTVAIIVADIADLFPQLANAIGAAGIKALLATSQIVGMQCPGLHSLFAGLNINFNQGADRSDAIAYAVGKVDSRFRSLQIDVAGYGTTGRLEAFARLPPPSQAGMQEVIARVSGRPFAGQRSLVVGGSRGLGAVTARIIAAGGGHPTITYRDSREEAELVAGDIRGAGSSCDILRYDALLPAAEQLEALQPVECCYYFATPKIFLRKSELFEADRLRSFLSFYADGFFNLCTTLVRDRTDGLAMFYPSTVAIEQGLNTTAEYAMAKSAGETLARYLNAFMPHIEILCRRLPRILTDQTATVGVASADNALDVMLAVVYEVQRMARHEQASSR
jgi:acyl dehydratase/NAD(P)-dependent dehydrogenase (short-subunit alcohol dehydrogenase family)